MQQETIYRERLQEFTNNLQQLNKKRSRLGWMRLVIIIITFALAMYLFGSQPAWAWAAIVVGIAAFLFTVMTDAKNNARIAHAKRLLFINEEELKILHYQVDHRADGAAFLPHEHPYAADLDLFGPHSLYQHIHRCTSEQGKQLLARHLLHPMIKAEIEAMQQAVEELSKNIHWRQEWMAAGMANPITTATQQRIEDWKNASMPYGKSFWKWLLWIYPLITLSTVGIYAAGIIPGAVVSLLIFLFFIIGLSISKNINETYFRLSKIVKELSTLQQEVVLFENLQVHAPMLKGLQAQLQQHGKVSTSVKELQAILNRFDYRLNIMVFFVFNTFLLWDLRQLRALHQWKRQHGQDVNAWFAILAQLEVINTLATLRFNHSNWVFPQMVDEHFTLHAAGVGHPLIQPGKCVTNTYSTTGTGRVSIITGSNMAGKSTFLRSIGVNIVLAQMGAPVFASAFTLSPVQLYSSMRIADNLAENTSTFYAELKKLQTIIEQVNKGEKVFVLLDEILRGTNSFDRHTGSKALVKQFIALRAVAVIATHDVELAELANSYITSIHNYHFDVQVAGEELYFDYKLKPGICQSMNASILMKKIGITID